MLHSCNGICKRLAQLAKVRAVLFKEPSRESILDCLDKAQKRAANDPTCGLLAPMGHLGSGADEGAVAHPLGAADGGASARQLAAVGQGGASAGADGEVGDGLDVTVAEHVSKTVTKIREFVAGEGRVDGAEEMDEEQMLEV
jgi:hypothetical protein